MMSVLAFVSVSVFPVLPPMFAPIVQTFARSFPVFSPMLPMFCVLPPVVLFAFCVPPPVFAPMLPPFCVLPPVVLFAFCVLPPVLPSVLPFVSVFFRSMVFRFARSARSHRSRQPQGACQPLARLSLALPAVASLRRASVRVAPPPQGACQPLARLSLALPAATLLELRALSGRMPPPSAFAPPVGVGRAVPPFGRCSLRSHPPARAGSPPPCEGSRPFGSPWRYRCSEPFGCSGRYRCSEPCRCSEPFRAVPSRSGRSGGVPRAQKSRPTPVERLAGLTAYAVSLFSRIAIPTRHIWITIALTPIPILIDIGKIRFTIAVFNHESRRNGDHYAYYQIPHFTTSLSP